MNGVILIHGLTGTPASMAPLTEALAKAGFPVATPLLAGHGETLDALAKTCWEDWYKGVCAAYDELKKKGVDNIFCAGLSLGSLLTLKLALDGARPLKKIVCIGTPLKLAPSLEKFLLPLTHLPPLNRIIKTSAKNWEEGVADEIGREIYKNSSYAKIPIHSVWELQKLQREVINNLSSLKLPVLMVHSRNDKVALPFNVDLFCRIATNVQPEILWVERSEHVSTLDFDKELIAKKVVEFFS